MAKAKGKTAMAKKDQSTTIVAFKAFNADMTCRGFKYEVGQSYEHKGDVSLCSSGFHACMVPFDCWSYYDSKTFARVALGGVSPEREEDSKIVGAKITIEVSLTLSDWIKSQAAAVIELCKSAKKSLARKEKESAAATGYRGHAAATGDSGHAAATGDSGHAAATGDSGHAAATGDSGHAAAIGVGGKAKAAKGGAITLSAWKWIDGEGKYGLVAVRSSLVGQNGVEPDTWYQLTEAGEFERAVAP